MTCIAPRVLLLFSWALLLWGAEATVRSTRREQLELTDRNSTARNSTERNSNLEAELGCCYQIGFGAMMKPCCLTTSQKKKEDCQNKEKMVGGGIGWSADGCPTDPDQANSWIQSAR